LADCPALAALPVSGTMTPIFTGSAALAEPDIAAAARAAATMHHNVGQLALVIDPSLVALWQCFCPIHRHCGDQVNLVCGLRMGLTRVNLGSLTVPAV
jgi:hypothetical protein